MLVAMIDCGRWPSNREEASGQDLNSRIAPDRNRRLRRICLYAPPFRTLSNASSDYFYRTCGVLWQIAPELAIGIADFGIGADSPILLDYRQSKVAPIVINLNWSDGGKSNSWVTMASSFPAFVEILGI